MTEIAAERGSYRDPDATVFYAHGKVLRSLNARATDDWAALSTTSFFSQMQADGRVIGTRPADVDLGEAPRGAVTVLEHDRIPFVSYPYEWTFGMLQDAAITHLEVLLAALDEGISLKDGTSFNMQWRGCHPTFIDIASFERIPSGPWIGYRQFCQTFLYPLFLDAYVGIPFQHWLLGHLDGFEPSEMRRILSGRRQFAKGVFRHVTLHSIMEQRITKGGQQIKADLGSAGFNLELTKTTVRGLLKLVRGLESKRAESAWNRYRTTCTYTDADRAAKSDFIESVLSSRTTELAFDLGANDGAYARMVAERGAYVIAADYDDVTVDSMYRSLRRDKIDNVLPIVVDLVDPPPARGWRGTERKAFFDRAQPDLVLALALVHHLAIRFNVPLPEIVDWFRSIGGTLVVEFVEPNDPMAKQLLANKRTGLFPDYRKEQFEQHLERRYVIAERRALPSGTRTLYRCEPC